jgi:hypothetical protein
MLVILMLLHDADPFQIEVQLLRSVFTMLAKHVSYRNAVLVVLQLLTIEMSGEEHWLLGLLSYRFLEWCLGMSLSVMMQ